MKPLYTFLFLACFTIPVLSQELNFNDLIYLFNNRSNIVKCDEYLAKRNFIFLEDRDSCITFSQIRNKRIDSSRLLSLSDYYIWLQSPDRATFDYFKQIALSNNLTLQNSGTDSDGNLRFNYDGDKYFISLIQGFDKVQNSTPFYRILFAVW